MADPNDPRLTDRSQVSEALRMMPSWKRKLLGVSLVVGLAGAGGQLASSALKSNPAPTANNPTAPAANVSPADAPPTPAPSGASGFVSATGRPAPQTDAPAASPGAASDPSPPTTLTQRLTPWMTHVGLSFFVGIVVGLIFRIFMKMALGITALIAALIFALSYFHVLNIDMTAVKTEYASVSAWAGDQVARLKDLVMHALPSSSSAAVGFFAGFKRR
jgi:uncharacterized membrane protein (Fun14 family)